MRILGAILAGGAARRFGADKALASLDGLALAEHVRRALGPHVDHVVSCGRALLDLEGLPDRPHPGLGPLAGVNAALHRAAGQGFDAVLTLPCDTPLLPPDLLPRLIGDCACYVADVPVIGFWPVALAPELDVFLASDPRRSMRGWAARANAVPVALDQPLPNVNDSADLAALLRGSPSLEKRRPVD